MTTFVLVPGMWLGGWAWQDVTEELRAAGHRVYPVTLTGLGERVHLGGPQVNLDTQAADVANLLRYEDLHDVVLVGHSFGGTVITAAADQVSERIAHLVYVDTVIPGRTPAFEEIEPDVKTAWLAEQKALAWEKAYKDMRARYTVLLPAPPADGSPPAAAPPPQSDIPGSSGEEPR